MSTNQSERLARESQDECEARLYRIGTNQRERLAKESQDEHEGILDRKSTMNGRDCQESLRTNTTHKISPHGKGSTVIYVYAHALCILCCPWYLAALKLSLHGTEPWNRSYHGEWLFWTNFTVNNFCGWCCIHTFVLMIFHDFSH